MKYSLILILLLFIKQVYTQVSEIKRDTTYFDQDWKKTIYLEDAKYARIVKRDLQGQIVGTVRDFYLPSWKTQFEGKLNSENPDVPIGKCTWYFENGKIQSSATYIDGKPSNDIVQYKEDGTKIECRDTLVEIFPFTQNKIVPYFDAGSSRVIHTITNGDLNDFIVQYKIQDEGSNSTFNMATSLMALYTGNIAGLMPLLSNNSSRSGGSTKNTFLVTSSRDAAIHFRDNKGSILRDSGYLYSSNNAINETKRFVVDNSVKFFYICIQNDNYKTDAISTVEVVALGRICK